MIVSLRSTARAITDAKGGVLTRISRSARAFCARPRAAISIPRGDKMSLPPASSISPQNFRADTLRRSRLLLLATSDGLAPAGFVRRKPQIASMSSGAVRNGSSMPASQGASEFLTEFFPFPSA